MDWKARVSHLLGGRRSELARQFALYDESLRKKAAPRVVAWGEDERGPYWENLPRWIADRRASRLRPKEFVDEVIWGQTCIFYAVRIQDDVLDGAISRSELLFAPLVFLAEGERTFSAIIRGNARFWTHYHRALRTTMLAVARVAQLQRDRSVPPATLLRTYGDVDTIFTVGSLAVCEKIGREEWIPRVRTFVREIGKVLLALDDLDDIGEDLADGRTNYAARYLLGEALAEVSDPRDLAQSWANQLDPAGLRRMCPILRRSLFKASRAIRPMALTGAAELIERVTQAVEGLAPPR